MKLSYPCGLAVAALLTLTAGVANAATIVNPGFENNFSGWTDTDPSAISESDVHSGSKSAKITGSGGRIEQDVAVSANTDYVLKAWIYERGTIGVEVGANNYSDGGNFGSFTQVSVPFNSGGQTTVTIYCVYNGGTGRFDDFTLEESGGGGPSGAIWAEDFNLSNGATVDNGDTAWSIDDSNMKSSGSFEVQNGKLEANNTGQEVIWISEAIDISAASPVTISVDISGSGTLDSTDYVDLAYRVDGGSIVFWSQNNDDISPSTETSSSISGDSLEIIAYFKLSASDEFYYLDNVTVTGSGGSNEPPEDVIDFSSVSTTSYGSVGPQDGAGSVTVQDDGATLYLDGNRWRDIPFNYTVTANTVLEFDFRSTDEGEMHAIGFDNDDNQDNTKRAFMLHGTQGWSNSYSTGSYSGSSFLPYKIYVGDFYTGAFDRIFFVNDNDSGNGNSYFRNVKVYEEAGASSPTITTTSLPDATQNQSYNQTLQASGGDAPLSWSVISGALPSGVSLSSSGQLSGTPTQTGTFNFTVEVEDQDQDSDTQALSLTVDAPGSPQLPSDILDLTAWKITIPFDSNGNDGPTNNAAEVTQPALDSYELPGYFEVNSTGDAVVFTAHAGGATTSGSGYPRCELREMISDGSDEASWSSGSGKHTMFIRQKVLHLPVEKPHVVVGQIHDDDDDVIVFRLEGSKLFIDINGDDGPTLDSSYTLGEEFTVMFVVENNQTKCYYNGSSTPAYTLNQSYAGAYFKAGCYTQSACDGPKEVDDESCDAYAQVEISELWVTHE